MPPTTGEIAAALLNGTMSVEAMLAEIRNAAPSKSTSWRVPRPRPASGAAPRAGGVGLVAQLAETLRQGLATTADTLARAEEALRKAGRERSDDELVRAADRVAQARTCAALVEADCLLAETAAQQAGVANSAADGQRRITVVPALPVLGTTVEAYVVSLQLAASHLAIAGEAESLSEVGLAIQKALGDCPELAGTASALIGAVATAWQTIGGVIRS